MSDPLRVLLVEDAESDAALVERALRQAGYDVACRRVETADEMRAALAAQAWDVVIADYRLPQLDAPAALTLLQRSGLDLPFIVVSGTVGEDVVAAMMKAGAHDYLMKDNLKRLAPAVAREIREAETRRERRQAEQGLRASEARFAAVFHSSPIAIALARLADGVFVDVNDAWVKLTGVPRDEAVGRTGIELGLWVDPGQRERLVAGARDSGRTRASEVELRSRSGGRLNLLVTAEVVEIEGHRGILTMAIDVSERKWAEDLLRESERTHRELVENLNDVIFTLNEAGRLAYVSPAIERVLGRSAADVVGHHYAEFVHPDDLDAVGRAMRDVFEGRLYRSEFRFKVNPGEYRWVRTSSRPLIEGGQVVGLTGILTDITEQRQAEEQARILMRAVDAHSDSAFWHDTESRFLYVNDAACKSLGYSREQLLQMSIFDVNPNATAEGMRQVWELLRREGSYSGETTHRRSDGSVFPVDISTTYVRSDGKEYACGFARDITERRRAERELRTSESFLNSIIEQSPFATWISDDKGTLIRLNQACRDLLRITDEEVVGKYNVLADSVVEQSGALPLARRVYDNGETVRFELDYDSAQLRGLSLAQSAHVVLDVTIFPLRDANGRITNAVIQHIDVTERRRAEQAQRESEEQFRRVFEQAAVGMSLVSPAGEWLQVNQRLCEILGYSRDELMRTSFRSITYPDDLEREAGRVEELVVGARSFASWEKRCVRKGGTTIWTRVTMSLFRSREGRPQYFVAVMEDITKRKRAEDGLSRSEGQLSAALKLAHLGHWEYDVSRDAFIFNDHFYALMRTTAEREGGYEMSSERYARRFCHPDDAALVAVETRRALEATDPDYSTELEHRVTFGDGQAGHVAVRIFIVKDAGGRTVRTYGVNQDITERVRSVEALRASEARLRAAFQAVTDGILVADVNDGSFAMANQAMCRMLGYSEPELLRLAIDDVHPIGDLAAAKEIFRKQASGEQPFASGVPVLRKDGSTFLADVHAVPLMLDEHKYLLGHFRDMTAFNAMEQQLRQSQKMEAIGQLAGGVAHDFNNVLGVILGHCDLMHRALRDDDPLANGVAQIKASAERAAGLTRQLLAFSRKQTLLPEVLDLNAAVRDMEGMLRRLIGEHIDLVTVLAADLGRVKADPSQIEQVIINLAVNARDAMPEGGQLTIETANVELDEDYARDHAGCIPGRHVLVAVTDNGCGMDAATRERIFEPFFTTKEKGRGTGLGLSTVYGIVRQSGGSIWVESAAARGSTFKVYLPRTEEAARAPVQRERSGLWRGNGERVLVVEDEPGMRAVVRDVLEELGYRATVAANGGEALLEVEERGLVPDLLVTDMVMPGMSGTSLAQRLRRKHPRLKVLFMSGYTDEGMIRQGTLDPGVPFIQKPFRIDDLANKVGQALRGE